MEMYKNLDTYQKILAIRQLAQWSDGRLLITADEYNFLCEIIGQENEIKGYGDDYKELTPSDFNKLIEAAKKEVLRENYASNSQTKVGNNHG